MINMSYVDDSIDVSEDVKELVSDIIAKHKLKETCTIKYSPGSQAGDGYSSKTYAIDISDDETSLNLFLKYTLEFDEMFPYAHQLWAGEIYFYNTIYPKYKEFLESKCAQDIFKNVPVCYGYNETKRSEMLALENLRKKGFTLFDRFTCMNDEHLKLVLTSYAKFHAVSFAMKDQRQELHEEFCKRSPNHLLEFLPKMASNGVRAFVEKLDLVKDKDILDRCDNLDSNVYNQSGNANIFADDYSVLIKGDSNVNNLMILYENDDRDHPKDLMLIDWQGMYRGSPIQDIATLFYCMASTEALDNYKYYQQVYHEELTKRIKELGSDPEVLYPRSVFEKQWFDYGLPLLGFSSAAIQIMLTESKNAPTLEKKKEVSDLFSDLIYDEEEYLRRTKHIARHMIDTGVI